MTSASPWFVSLTERNVPQQTHYLLHFSDTAVSWRQALNQAVILSCYKVCLTDLRHLLFPTAFILFLLYVFTEEAVRKHFISWHLF